MKKTILLTIISFCIELTCYSQITTGELPYSVQQKQELERMNNSLDIVDLPTPDMKKVLYEDSINSYKADKMQRCAVRIPVEYNANKHGRWIDLEDGSKLWQLSLRAQEAKTMDLTFKKFWLPKGGEFFVFNPKTNETIGAVTADYILGDKSDPHRFSTGIIKGDILILEYYQPKSVTTFPEIELSGVFYGYRYKSNKLGTGFNSSGSCQINVNCPDGANWQDEKNAVARIYVKFTHEAFWCTGFLVNNTKENGLPLFLTADHCLKGNYEEFDAYDNGDASDWIFYWGYEIPCSGSNIEPNHITTTGAIVEANNPDNADFALLRLIQNPRELSNFNPYYLGWDRSSICAEGGVGIHHPRGDVKKISTYTTTPSPTYYLNNSINSSGNHWKVNWTYGTTEQGSSGSPLIDNNHHVIGQLHGGESSCTSPTAPDWYGRFGVSWTGNGNSDYRRKLSYWLDPLGSNNYSIGGSYVMTIDGPSLVCDSSVYVINNLPPNYNVVWSKQSISATMYLIQNSPYTNQCTVQRIPGVPSRINLIASIYKDSILCFQLTKELYSLTSSFGSFSQQSCTYYNVHHPAITSQPVKEHEANFVHQGCLVTVNSMYIRPGVTITHTGVTPVDWYVNYDSNYLNFSLPLLSGGIPFNILINGEQSCGNANILFFSATGNGNLSQNLLVIEPYEDHFVLNIEHNQLPSESIELNPYTKESKWLLEVYSGQTGRKMVDYQVSGSCFSLDTSNWESGLYVIRVLIDGEVLTQKITIK